jgi:hypothetical protein
VTYYPPPSEYAYLYDWVPDPFLWDGFGFGGFFILVDFDRHHHHHHITNHVTNANGTLSRINATTRAGASAIANTANTANTSVSRDADRSMRDPGRATRDMDRFSSPSTHFSTGGGHSYGGGGFHGGGGHR